ncbi:hypothetical protein TCT1_05690 [Xenorhabdus sp. TCT-1]|uniref:N-acetyltransferase n=2 Tax=Xenorhabdus taiwanensis TaxID=3085177 RepID=A0ABM8JWG7_9GAMM|nr:hypothetical protein TCT1_05690 [Xenorhabdus sp. TCT-1]
MFRSKSFNTHRPVASGSLIRTQSFSEKWPNSVNVRASIVVKEVNPEEALNAMTAVSTGMMNNGWECYVDSDDYDREQEKWNNRFIEAYNKSCHISSEAKKTIEKINGSEILFFIAYFRGMPIGGLQLSPINNGFPDFPEVINLATHCGIRSCGVFLIEQAVNKSQQLGSYGALKLNPLPGSRSAYREMGFIETAYYMELHPVLRRDKWKYDGATNSYKYRFN